MPGPIHGARSDKRAALVISVLYALLAALWIGLSDHLLGQLIRDPEQLTRFQSYKGWLFVAVTSALLYVLLRARVAFAQEFARPPVQAGRWRWRNYPALMILAITAPIAALLAYTYYSDATDRYRLTGATVLNLAEVTAADSEKFIAEARVLLERLAARPQINALDRSRCDPILGEIPQMMPRFANILVVDRTGEVICTAVPQRPGASTSAAKITWFERVSRDNRFVIGPPAVGFITGRRVLTMAQPLRDERGTFIGAIGMPVDLARYEILAGRADLPPGAVITLIDSQGTIVARSPEPETWVGRNLRGTGIVDAALARQRGVSEALSSTGVWRVFGYVPVAGADWFAIAQVPSDWVYADARAALLRNAAVSLAVVLAVALVAAQLNRTLEVRARTEAELRASEERYRLLVDSSPYTIGVHQDGKIVFVNPAGVRLFGAGGAADLIGTPIRERIDPAHLDAALDRIARMLKGESGLYPTEDRYVRLDGSRVDVEVTAAPFSHGGRPAIQVIALDISERKRAEDALRESEEKLRLFVHCAPSAIAMFDREMRYVAYSQRWLADYGLGNQELAGRSHYEVFPDLPERWKAIHRRCLAGAIERADEDPFPRQDGSVDWVRWEVRPWNDAAGGIGGLIIFSEVITARKRAEQALGASEERYRRIVETALEGIYAVDENYRITFVNPRLLEMLGYGREELIGRTSMSLLDVDSRALAQASAERRRAGAAEQLELTYLRKDGRALRALLSAAPIMDAEGGVAGAVGMISDITARHQAEALHTQLAAIVQSSKEAIYGIDPEGTVTSWNPGAEHAFGYRAEEMIGRHISVLAPPDRQAEPAALVERIGRGETVSDYETERIRKDDKCIEVALTLSPIQDDAGKAVGISTIARDITEKKRAERALQRVNRTLLMLSSCNEALVRATSEQQLLDDLCRAITEIGGYQLAWVGFAQPAPDKFVSVAARGGSAAAYLDGLRFAWDDSPDGRGPTGTAIRRGERAYIRDFQIEQRSGDWCRRAMELGLRSCIALPLAGRDRVLGALTLCSQSAAILTDEEIALLDELAADLAYGILALRAGGERDAAIAGHQASLEKARKALEDAVQAIATAAEMRDAYTAGHQRRVAHLSAAIAQELGLPEEQIHGLHLAGVVHDIGKIQVPAEILSKPTRLSAVEYALIQSHSEAGYDILKGIDFPWPIAQIVLQHHERLDGTGYPQRLKGEAILLEARIMSVADTVEAMASHRPYRPGLGIDRALDEITQNRGRLYDPAAVDACVRLFREKGYAIS